jgi:hypothetical protein
MTVGYTFTYSTPYCTTELETKVKTQNRYFILYLNSWKKGPDKSHSFFLRAFNFTHAVPMVLQSSPTNSYSTQHFIQHLKKDIKLFTTENHYLGSLCFMVFFILCLRDFLFNFLFFAVGVEFILKSDFKRKLTRHERE